MNKIEFESDAISYEFFLNKAFLFDKRNRRASKKEIFNLIDAENGEKSRYLPSKEKQLETIKTRMKIAFDLFLKQKLNGETETKLINLLMEIDSCDSSSSILLIAVAGSQCIKSLNN